MVGLFQFFPGYYSLRTWTKGNVGGTIVASARLGGEKNARLCSQNARKKDLDCPLTSHKINGPVCAIVDL
jgi:hypothetical protein